MSWRYLWACFRRGHQMSEWRQRPHRRYWVRSCERCALRFEYSVDPAGGAPTYRHLAHLLDSEWRRYRQAIESGELVSISEPVGEQRRCPTCKAPISDHGPLDLKRCADPQPAEVEPGGQNASGRGPRLVTTCPNCLSQATMHLALSGPAVEWTEADEADLVAAERGDWGREEARPWLAQRLRAFVAAQKGAGR